MAVRGSGIPTFVSGEYNSESPIVDDGQQVPLQTDDNGNLLVYSVNGGGGGGNVTITSPLDGGDVAVKVENFPATQPVSGTITADQGTSPWVTEDASDGNPGSASPLFALQVAGSDGTDLRTLLTSNTGQVHVIVDSGGGGGTQYVDGTAETVGEFTGTVALGYNGTDVVGLRLDASNNLKVNLETALPAGSNVIGGTNLYLSGTEVGLGTQTAADSVPVALPSATITTLTPPTAAAIASAIVSNPPTTFDGIVTNAGTFAVQEATLDATIVAQGTSASSKILIAGGKSNDATAQYRELPLGGSGRSVIVEGYAGGTAVPISGTVTTQVTQGTRQAVSFTSSTPADTSNTIALVAYANVAVTLHYSGTVTGGQMFFEVSDDNSNWYGITMAPTDDTPTGAVVTNFPVDNYTLSSAAGNITWQMFVGGYAYFRVRMHIQVVGSGTATVAVIPSTAACDPAPQVTQGITPWVTAGVAASGAAVTGNPVLVAGQDGTDARTLLTDNTGQLKILVENASAIATTDKADGTPGSAVPATALQVAGTDGTDLRTLLTDNTGQLKTVADVAQASTTSGQVGPLVQMATVTSAPTDSNATTNPLRGDAGGCLRTNPAGQTGSYGTTYVAGTGSALPTITVPAGKKWLLQAMQLTFIVANSGSARTCGVFVKDASGHTIAAIYFGVAATTNTTTAYSVGQGMPYSTSIVQSNASAPFPPISLGPGCEILALEISGVAGDTVDLLASYTAYND